MLLIAERSLLRQLLTLVAQTPDTHRRITDYLIAFSWSLKHQYTLILQRTVYLFCALLPFALVGDLHYMTPFVSVFISYTFLSLDSLAEELEDPFGISANDLPLNAICTTIERNLRDMIGHYPLPELPKPDRNYNLT
jgi:predicted membrane chloride channel (bestrophin family)